MKESSVADRNIGGCYNGFVRRIEGESGGRGFPVCPNIAIINRWRREGWPRSLPSLVATVVKNAMNTRYIQTRKGLGRYILHHCRKYSSLKCLRLLRLNIRSRRMAHHACAPLESLGYCSGELQSEAVASSEGAEG